MRGLRAADIVTAGTVLHRSKLPLTVWFWAAWLMATHSNGISALQLYRQLGLGSYKTAWLLAAKLRHAMTSPDRTPLSGLVEVDESALAYRAKDNAPVATKHAGQGRSKKGKLPIIAAVEVSPDGHPGRIRLAAIADYSAHTLTGFITTNIEKGATLKTDGWSGYDAKALSEIGIAHDPHTVGAMAAHIILPWTHRVFSNLKTWALGVYHGLRPKHLQHYLDEFTFRWNRRRNRPAGFATLLGIATRKQPIPYKMLIQPELTG